MPMDDRTTEQIEADKALEEALNQIVSAYSIAPDGAFMINNYIVIGNGRIFNDDGEQLIYWNALRNGGTDFNWDEGIGMLRRSQHELEQQYLEDGNPF